MPIITTRRRLLAGSAAALALPAFARAQSAVKPRLTVISQWSAGSDGAAITALGKKFEEKGGTWQHSPVPGLHHRDDEQAARSDHRRRSAGLFATQGPRDCGLVEDRPDR
ncbi:ABC-type glycerol-3-phosphate transport system substrate-binding protein [Bradyrhizobium sp. LM2.7]